MDEMDNFSMRLSHKLLNDRFLCRVGADVKHVLDQVLSVFFSFLALLVSVDVFSELFFVEE